MAKGSLQWLCGALCTAACLFSQTTVLYETHFEQSEGYNPDLDLAGQNGWLMEQGSGGNGLIEGQFADFGQQAYLGFVPGSNQFSSLWRPIDYQPNASTGTIVKVSVVFQIIPSTVGTQDDFRWSVYNIPGDRLFSVDFETSTGLISFVPQDGTFISTGSSIDFEGFYRLDIWMDFARNLWSAFLNDFLVINSETITQNSSPLSFGDADAVWFLRGEGGDNYMVFDNYRVTAEAQSSIPGYVEAAAVSTNGFFTFQALGEKGLKYSVEVTQDFVTWFSLGTYTNTVGAFNFEDTTSKGFTQGFYRLREVP